MNEICYKNVDMDYGLIQGFLDGLRPTARVTVDAWADKYRRLSSIASSEPGQWRTDRTPYLREIMSKLTATDPTERVVVMKGAQVGLALSLDTPIPTVDGWKTMGTIALGDTVFDENGNACRVTLVTPVMYDHQCFEVTFSDGSKIVADADHNWTVWDEKKYESRKRVTINTAQIAKTFKHRARNRYAVDLTKPLELPFSELVIPPYTLGVWLGDGNSSSNRVTTHKDDAAEMLSYILEEGIQAHLCDKHTKGNCTEIVFSKPHGFCQRNHDLSIVGVTKGGRCAECHRRRSNGNTLSPVVSPKFGKLLSDLNVLNNKHIPIGYLRASVAQRFELLRGLMDTDGHVTKEGYCEWYSCSPKLTEDVFELIASLGFKPVMKFKRTGKPMSIDGKRFYETVGVWRITFQAYAESFVVNLKRKRERLKRRADCRHSEIERRRITNVVEVESVPVRCIQVDSPSHLYLVGKGMIPTHNTEAGNNWLGYIMHISPAPTLMVMPTEAMVKKNSKTRIDPMIEASPILRERIAPARSRDSGNTMLQKEFPGGVLMLVGANSASGLRSMPVRFLFLDEVDAYPMDLDGEGSPLALAMARTRTFAKRKIFEISTPTISGLSIIESEFAATDQRHFHVPCPHCGVFQDLVWGQVRWEPGKPETAVYECRECNELIEERYKPKMLAHGEWKAHAPENIHWRTVGYHINSLYSPYGWYSWGDAVKDYEEAANDANKMKTFVNTVQGLTWKEDGESPQFMALYDKREHYEFNVPPMEVAFLTAGMDVQGDRLEVEIVGWGVGKRSWSVDYRVFDGDTAKPDVWKNVADLLNESWTTEDGRQLRLSLLCIDSGFNTSHVYNFCLNQDSSRVIPIKGQERLTTMASAPRPIVVSRSGSKIGSVKVWGVGVNMIKSELYGWLKMNKDEDGSKPNGYCTFPQYDQHHFKSLTAEKVHVVKDKKGFDRIEWVKEFQRNERLDCRVYARAAAYIIGIDRMSDDQVEAMRGQAPVDEPKPSSSGGSSFWGGRGGFWK